MVTATLRHKVRAFYRRRRTRPARASLQWLNQLLLEAGRLAARNLFRDLARRSAMTWVRSALTCHLPNSDAGSKADIRAICSTLPKADDGNKLGSATAAHIRTLNASRLRFLALLQAPRCLQSTVRPPGINSQARARPLPTSGSRSKEFPTTLLRLLDNLSNKTAHFRSVLEIV